MFTACDVIFTHAHCTGWQVVTAYSLARIYFHLPKYFYLFIIYFKTFLNLNRWPGRQPYCGFSVTRHCFQWPGAIGRLLSSNPAMITQVKLNVLSQTQMVQWF